jgi:hypothetical protein
MGCERMRDRLAWERQAPAYLRTIAELMTAGRTAAALPPPTR